VLRVGVFGAAGRMGTAVCEAVGADPGLELVAVVDPAHAGEKLEPSGLVAATGPEAMAEAGAEVAVDFTVASAAQANAIWCADNGVHSVIGTTGFSPAVLDEMKARFQASVANCVFAPNFAIGAVLMMRFAELAAPFFESVEIVELHHDGKVDAPSGTAILTAQRISEVLRDRAEKSGGPVSASPATGRATGTSSGTEAARGTEAAPGVRVHSVRLRGLVAHQEVIFGTAGQTLTLRHDSMDRSSFMPGVLLAVKQVPHRRGLTVGLDALLGF
jgi:4-hydroxy-tetrahydrodipicolinate reductase